MALSKKEDYIFYQGEKFQVEFYFTETGEMPAKEYLDKESLGVQLKLAALVKRIADHGRLFNKTKFRKVDSKENMFEFKPLDHRFFSFFYEGKKIIITNAYRKKSQKVSKRDLEKARNMKMAYTNRLKEGVYYEKK
ncbi:MAG: type II toxin-antitoxin system RelE/ParE family toxin [Actinobacteria bacterium]|nr:type II toxin-antitoxin system RelE/ParE family toxin [Actinomycetota bacterium]